MLRIHLHDEPDIAEAREYVLWCQGRLGELRQAGLLKGPCLLTEAGWTEYRKLIASGFLPSRQKVIWTLQTGQAVPEELAEQLAVLMRRP